MKETISSSLLTMVNQENYYYLAQLFVVELLNVLFYLVDSFYQTTLPSESELFMKNTTTNIQFFQTFCLRMSQQSNLGNIDVTHSIEEAINSVFPGKLGFFALFLYYGNNHDFNCFVMNGKNLSILILYRINESTYVYC